MQDNHPRDGDAGLSEHSRLVSPVVAEQPDLVTLKAMLVAILAAFDKSLPRLGALTKNPTKQIMDSEPNKGGRDRRTDHTQERN